MSSLGQVGMSSDPLSRGSVSDAVTWSQNVQ